MYGWSKRKKWSISSDNLYKIDWKIRYRIRRVQFLENRGGGVTELKDFFFQLAEDNGDDITVRGCALDSGTLTTDTEIIRMSHCGGFYYNDRYPTLYKFTISTQGVLLTRSIYSKLPINL